MIHTLESILAGHPFLQGLAPEHLQLLVSCASNVHFEAGQDVFQEGEEANAFYIIRHGKVAIELLVPGSGPRIIQTLEAGEVLGWSWLFPPYRWQFNARAVELTRVIALDGKCLRTKCDEDHDLGYELMKRFARIFVQRLHATRLQLLDVYAAHA
jgi:CRP-like cAMP-binding protein